MTQPSVPEQKTGQFWPTLLRAVVAVVLGMVLVGSLVLQLRQDRQRTNLQRKPPAQVEQHPLYHQTAVLATGFSASRAVAVGADGTIYIAGDRQVRLTDTNSARISEITLAADPTCLAIAEDRTLFVGMRDHVEVFDKSGSLLARWDPLPGKPYITSLAADGDTLWVADAGNRIIRHFDRQGNQLGTLGQRDDAKHVPGLVVPSPHLDVAASPDGRICVSNPGRHVVESYTREGSLVASWGTASMADDGFSGCCNPTDIAILPDGRVVTSEKGLPRVKVYSADGALLGMVAGRKEFTGREVGIDLAVDDQGQIFLLDPVQNTVRIYAKKKKR